MRLRLALPLVAACIPLAFAPAIAAKTTPTPITQPDGSRQPPFEEINSSAPCPLGILPPPAVAFGYILPPDDRYYTLLDPASCPTCPAGGLRATVAHVLLYWTSPCQIPVTVSITPAEDPDGDGCFTPNPFAQPLCPPVTYTVSDGGVLNQCVDVALPLDPACCFTQKAFLTITFDQGTCPNGRPAFCGPGSCQNCRQYNYYPGAAFPGDDLCVVLSPQGVYGVNMWADTDCCAATPNVATSWGTLKTLYR